MCVNGRCRRGIPGDAGVLCGGTLCDVSQQCCIDTINLPRCIAVGDVCLGTSALCDGVEDCQAGDRCCADAHMVTCQATCDRFACRDTNDCPSTVPNCCFTSDTPWGVCSVSPC